MGLDFAIDELYSTGWAAPHGEGCEHSPSGRLFPGVRRIESEFESSGRRLRIRYIAVFDCHRAEWTDERGEAEGAVVGATEQEAAVYALAQLRKQGATIGA